MSDASCTEEKPRHIPRRTCVGCRKRKRKEKLLRCVIGKDGLVCWDKAKVFEGRGAYICGEACLKKAHAYKAFQRAFRGRQVELSEEMHSCEGLRRAVSSQQVCLSDELLKLHC